MLSNPESAMFGSPAKNTKSRDLPVSKRGPPEPAEQVVLNQEKFAEATKSMVNPSMTVEQSEANDTKLRPATTGGVSVNPCKPRWLNCWVTRKKGTKSRDLPLYKSVPGLALAKVLGHPVNGLALDLLSCFSATKFGRQLLNAFPFLYGKLPSLSQPVPNAAKKQKCLANCLIVRDPVWRISTGLW